MKLLNFTSVLVLLTFFTAGCVSQNLARLPQSSEFEDTEFISDDVEPENDPVADEDQSEGQYESRLDVICKESNIPSLRENDRVVTKVDGKYISGNILQSFNKGEFFIVRSDYGPQSQTKQPLELKRTAQELSKALECAGTKSKKVYGVFKVGVQHFSGHLREVYKNGIVRFVNDRGEELFSSRDGTYLEIRSDLKGRTVLFYERYAGGTKSHQLTGEFRRMFENGVVVIKSGGRAFLRRSHEIAIADY